VLAGPRQVGKTTLANQLLKKLPLSSHYTAADAVAHAGAVWIEQQWAIARIKIQQSGGQEFVLVITTRVWLLFRRNFSPTECFWWERAGCRGKIF